MITCLQCEGEVESETLLCETHRRILQDSSNDKDWSDGNRIWCDYFHRGSEISRCDDFDGVGTIDWRLRFGQTMNKDCRGVAKLVAARDLKSPEPLKALAGSNPAAPTRRSAAKF